MEPPFGNHGVQSSMAPRSFLLFPLCLGLAIAIPEVQAPTTLTQPHESDLERWPWWNKLRECKNVCDRNKYTSREDKRYCKEGCGYGPKNSKAGCNKKCTRTRVYAKDGTYVVEGKYTLGSRAADRCRGGCFWYFYEHLLDGV